MLLFAEASEEQITLISSILGLFCRCSRQKISEAKTRIFFSSNVDESTKSRICQLSGFQITDDLGKYLGIPILYKKVNRRSFQFVIDKVDQRLSNWKAKTLSLAGRLTLCKLVVQALPTYVMQSAWVPRSVCDVIDKRCRDFLWGDTVTVRHMHLVNWGKVCKPKAWGAWG